MTQVTFIGNVRSSPEWAADFGGREHIEPWPASLDPSQFADQAGIIVTNVGIAAQGAISITISALALSALANTILIAQGDTLIPAGTTLFFGGTSYAQTTADAVNGATTISVLPLPTAIADQATATYTKYGTKFITSGTLLGRTYAQRDAGTPFGPWAPGDDEEYLLYFDIANANLVHDAELYRHGSRVKENYLPNYTAMVAGLGLADPTVAPTLTHAGVDGSLGAGVYTVGYSFFNAAGETKLSPTAKVTKLTTEHIAIADIAFPAGATGIRFYVSTAPGDSILGLARELAAHSATTLLTDSVGAEPTAYNTTSSGYGAQLARIRQLYTCIKGQD